MTTSFPSTASDLGTLLAGGKQPNTNAQLKGIFAGLGGVKPGAGGSTPSTKSDFETMLDAPATPANASAGTAIPVTAQPAGEFVAPVPGAAPSVLAAELGAFVTTTLQIKGMVGGQCHPTTQGPVTAPVAEDNSIPAPAGEGEATPTATGEGETQSGPPVLADSEGNDLPVLPLAPAITEPAAGPALPRHIKLFAGRGHPVRGHGWNHAHLLHPNHAHQSHPGVAGKSFAPVKAETASMKPILPTSCFAADATLSTGITPSMGVTPDMIVGAIVGIPIPTVIPSAATVPEGNASDLSSAPVAATNTESLVAPLLGGAAVFTPGVSVSSTGVELPSEIAPVLVPTFQPAAPGIPTSNLPAVAVVEQPVSSGKASSVNPLAPTLPDVAPSAGFTVNEASLPVVDGVEATVDVVPESPLAIEANPITPELRREVVETVAAMLAPFLGNLPMIPRETFSAQSAAQTVNVRGAVEVVRTGQSLTVTVKIGEESRFSFELPQASMSEARTTAMLAATIPTDETGQPPVPAPVAFRLPANLANLAKEIVPLDFRVQLKASIEAAWQGSEQPEVELAAVVPPVPVVGEMPLAGPSFAARASVPASPAVAAGESPVAPRPQVVTAEVDQALIEPPAQENAAAPSETPVEVTIKLPGYGTLTAQIVAADAAANALSRKSGMGLGRAEKNADGPKADRVKPRHENQGLEKTFLSTGGQPLKPESNSAGTDVAISDDTMPASFTSRRVTIDQLEFPPRFNVREIQPILTRSQDFPVTTETPVATTPAPVLAHRAVETIFNVVEAQRQGSANASSVNLHFRFGGDDLAVRVQMRGGEVHTQFLTDSAELRSALSKEWQNVAGQGVTSGLRLQDPLIVPAGAGSSNGFGSMPQGQNQARQQAQQQQADQAATMFPELQTFRRGSPAAAPRADTAPRVAVSPHTSQHLTATA